MAQQSPYVIIASNKSPQNSKINAPEESITFWKFTTRPHTMFAIANNPVEIQNLGFGKNAFISVPKAGTLMYKCHFEFNLPALTGTNPVAWTHYPGLALISELQIVIGSQDFDKHTGAWMYIWSELTIPTDKRAAFLSLIGHRPELTTLSLNIPAATIIVPVFFWFCRRPSLALQLASLDFAEVRFKLKVAPINTLVINAGDLVSANSLTLDGQLFVDYVHLDEPEFNSLIDTDIELVFESVQTYEFSTIGNKSKQILQIAHPTKFVAWTNQDPANISGNRMFDFTNSGTTVGKYWTGSNPMSTAVFNIYASQIDQERNAAYYNEYVPMERFTRGPAQGINVMCFALSPEDPQPTGTLNFSKVDQANMVQTMTDTNVRYDTKLYVFAYNTLTITNGQIGLEFASGKKSYIDEEEAYPGYNAALDAPRQPLMIAC